jgi:hypothetical protein
MMSRLSRLTFTFWLAAVAVWAIGQMQPLEQEAG